MTFFDTGASRKQFIVGISSGVVLSIPFVFHKYTFFGSILENIFSLLSGFIDIFSGFLIFKWLILFFAIFWFIEIACGVMFQDFKSRFFKYHRIGIFGFLGLIILGVFILTFCSLFFVREFPSAAVYFGKYIFVSFGSIVSYYILVSLLEEGSKYITILGFSGKRDFDTFQNYICLAACVALGFSFFENIVYSISYIHSTGINTGLIQLIFFRSIFSIILHLLSSMLLATAFWYIIGYAQIQKKHIYMFFSIAVLGILSHTFFDVALSFGMLGFLFLYIIAIYIFLSYLTQRQNV